jgi:serine protease Do
MPGYEQIADRLRRLSVQVVNGRGGGSGVIWNANGSIVTNAHVVPGADVEVIDASGHRARARVIKRDPDRDLALLETRLARSEAAEIGDSDSVRPGQMVLAVGNPLGLTGAVTAGVIHSIGPLDFGPRRNWIQADIRLAPGNSGGMLADAAGRVIGINTMIFHGMGLAAPSNEVDEFVRGESDGWKLGVEMILVSEGLVIVAIEPGSVAERAEVLVGDVIQCGPEELRRLLGEARRGGSVDIPILRGGRVRTLRVHKAERQGARAA